MISLNPSERLPEQSENTARPPLKYYFHVQYYDDTHFDQNVEDVSLRDPKRSAMYDVRLGDVYRFWLEGCGHKFLVDLSDGHFEIDDEVYWPEEAKLITPIIPLAEKIGHVPSFEEGRLQLFYFRKHEHDAQVSTRVNAQRQPEIIAMKEIAHRITYLLGWQTMVGGKKVEKIVEIK